jgi:uncharacterized protein (TIGR02466 family)
VFEFRLPFYHSNIIKDKNLLKEYEKTSERLVKENPEGWGHGWSSFCNSWNSLVFDGDLIFTTDYFPNVRNKIDDAIKTYIKLLGIDKDKLPLDTCESWLNATSKYKFQERHSHEPYILSGCLYLTEYQNQGGITFINPLCYKTIKDIDDDKIKSSTLNKNCLTIHPCAGDLIIFPSHIEHFVEQNMSDNNRYSLCFNITSSEL